MPSNLEPIAGNLPPRPALPTRTSRALANVERQAMVRMARVQAHAMVQTVKVQELDAIAREAMTGHAMLTQWRTTLAHCDPLLDDELRFFTDTARLGAGELLADTVSDFCREGRSW